MNEYESCVSAYEGTPIEEIVENIQAMLLVLSRGIEQIERVNPDGIYGEETESSVRSFQRYAGLDEDGRVDYLTFTRLCELFNEENQKGKAPKKAAHFQRRLKNGRVSVGNIHDLVTTVQIMLNAAAIMYGFGALEENGVYDPPTAEAVRAFQRLNGIEPSGEVDFATWNRLTDVYEKYVDSE